MPGHKKQHYVPQVYLRNFSKDGKTIGCCYVDAEKQKFHLTEEAPIKSQACKDYFYTKDTRLEEEFSKIEGEANTLIQKILLSEHIRLTAYEDDFLKQYVLFQNIRTPFHANEYEAMMVQFYHHIAPENKDAEIKLKGKQIFILQTFLPRIAEIAQQFRLIILENHTDIPFVTSPEPAVFFNPYQRKRKQTIYGIMSHGGMFYLPLSAKKAVLLYDPLAYKIKGKHLVSCLHSDVAFLNILILDFIGMTKVNLFYFDNNITDIRETISLILKYAKENVELSFVRERFYLFGLPKRHSLITDEMQMQNNHMSIEEYHKFMRENRE